jgi:hypothetical protein
MMSMSLDTRKSGNHVDDLKLNLADDIEYQLRFQRRWQFMSMCGYVLTTTGTLMCSSGATYLAAVGMTKYAAIASAVATVLVGTEKAMLFREKWKFHLLMHTRLSVLRANIRLGTLGLPDASSEFASIIMNYAEQLPVSSREQH